MIGELPGDLVQRRAAVELELLAELRAGQPIDLLVAGVDGDREDRGGGVAGHERGEAAGGMVDRGGVDGDDHRGGHESRVPGLPGARTSIAGAEGH